MKLVLTATVLTSTALVDATWSFAEMLEDPLSEATLMHLEEELGKAASNSTGSHQAGSPLFADLSKMINDTMSPAILNAHDSAQSQLNGFRTAFEVCGEPDVAGDSGHGVTSKAITDKLAEHRQCRAKQGSALTAADTCTTNLAKEQTVRDAACRAVPGSDGTPPVLDKDGHVGCKVIDGDYEGWLNSFEHQVDQLKNQYDEAAGGCGNASKLVDDMLPKCQAAKASAAANKTACDSLQAAADQMGCAADPTAHAACTTYHQCYDSARDNYVNANESIAAAQANRTVSWRVLKRMQCLLSEEAAGATHEGIDKCREATIDTSHLDLVYPAIPEKVDCSHVVGGPRPCTPEWIVEYGDMPANAPAVACTPCAVESFNVFEIPGRTCSWSNKHEGKYSAGWADVNDQTPSDLASAQKRCAALESCNAVTCDTKGGCTMRKSGSVTDSPSGEVTYLKSCIGQENVCGKGYFQIGSDVPGWGTIESELKGKVADIGACKALCDRPTNPKCMSFEFIPDSKICNLNSRRNGQNEQWKNQIFCSRANYPQVSAPTPKQGCPNDRGNAVRAKCLAAANGVFFDVLDGVYTLSSLKDRNMYASVAGDSKDTGANVLIWNNPGNPATQWRVRFVGVDEGALYTLENVNAPGMYMNVQGDSFSGGANVHMWNNPWSPASQWYIVPQGDFFVVESARAIGQYLNLKSARTDRGNTIQLWSNPGKVETRWVLQKVEQCSDEITINGQSGFCSHWCSTPGKWGCGVASVGSYTCDCTGCNGCGLV